MQLIKWLFILVVLISIGVVMKMQGHKTENVIVYDGSENNPYIEGVQ